QLFLCLAHFFFFYCSCDHLDLHSFPTRRSSDLEVDARSLEQLERCAEFADHAVLCADHHPGYSQPIGGVVAYREHVSLSGVGWEDRKSTRLNSSHSQISYAVFCLKKKKT